MVSQSTDRGGLRSLTLSHGLSDLLVNIIYKDKEGYVWFGTESSIDRFDGNQILRMPVPGDKRKSRRVLSIIEDNEGTIFVGTTQGLFYVNKGERELHQIDPKKLDCSVKALCSGSDNQLLIGTDKGLYIYNLKTSRLTHRLLTDDNMSDHNNIIGLWLQDNNHLWALTTHKLWNLPLNDGTATVYNLPTATSATILCESNGIIYVGTDGDGILPFSIKSLDFSNPIKIGNNIVTSLSAGDNNELLIGTDGEGIYVYSVKDETITEHLTTHADSKMQLRSNSVYSTLKDEKGILWVGYYQSGIDYTPMRAYTPELVALPANLHQDQKVVRAFDKAVGFTVIGTHGGVILMNDKTGESKSFSTPEISSNMIMAVKYWKGNFYIGTYHGGLYKLNPSTGSLTPFGPAELNSISVFYIENGPDNDLWVATSEGIYRFKDGNPSPIAKITSRNSQLPTGNVYTIFFDSLGRGWISTENGLAIWNGQYVQTSGFPTGFINNMKIRSIYEDSDHTLYFAPDRGEIWKSDLSLQNFNPIHENHEGRFGQVVSLIEDPAGWIWAGTDKGLIRFDKKHNDHFMVFNHIGDISNPVYTLATPLIDENKNIWMGLTSGLQKINMTELSENTPKTESTPLTISNIESGGTSLNKILKGKDGQYEIKLEDHQRELSLTVTDFNFRFRDFFEIDYFLEGVDTEWQSIDGNNIISYHDIQPGKYILRIRESGKPETETILIVRKSGPFPWWWIVGGVLLIILGITIPIYIRHKRELKRLATSESGAKAESSGDKSTTAEIKHALYRTTRLSDEECKRLLRKLDNIMKTEKPFKNPDLKIKDLAELVDTNSHSLSYLFNQYLKKSYYDYVNEWRVEEFKELVKNSDTSKYTLVTMAEKCGFSSRASFFRHFKNSTGMTPAEYLKKI